MSGNSIANFQCSDRDECLLGQHDCHKNADCINQPGGYVCSCKPGYGGSGKVCADLNECSDNGHTCGESSLCKNVLGGHTCICLPGFKGDGYSCTDVDECQMSMSICQNIKNDFR